MPLYEYECDSCGSRFERIQKFSDPPVTVCPTCGGAVRKLFSSPAIQFKGSGFYITDYAKSGKSGDSGTDKAPASGGEKSEKSNDAKADSATKTESSPKADSSAGSAKSAESPAKPAGKSPTD